MVAVNSNCENHTIENTETPPLFQTSSVCSPCFVHVRFVAHPFNANKVSFTSVTPSCDLSKDLGAANRRVVQLGAPLCVGNGHSHNCERPNTVWKGTHPSTTERPRGVEVFQKPLNKHTTQTRYCLHHDSPCFHRIAAGDLVQRCRFDRWPQRELAISEPQPRVFA